MIARVDQLSSPPIVGRFYLVPTVRGLYFGRTDDWPVTGPAHEDERFFNFPWRHFHIDIRFLSWRQRRHIEAHRPPFVCLQRMVARSPLSEFNNDRLPEPALGRRHCWSADTTWPEPHNPKVRNLQTHYAGDLCRRSAFGFVCPHRGARLGSIAPVDGVITCPLHGLRIDAATGLVLSTCGGAGGPPSAGERATGAPSPAGAAEGR